jgi:uncharacterized protein YgbK (DUF1537 family)
MQIQTANLDTPQTAANQHRFDCVRILADDLTGACDSAAAFLPMGGGVRVWLGLPCDAPEMVQAVNSASREMSGPLAAAAANAAASAISPAGSTLWFKKVDSAGRGPIAEELLATHQRRGTRAILFAPSFPAAGRTVAGGVLTVIDASGTRFIDLIGRMTPVFPNLELIQHPEHCDQALRLGKTLLLCDATTEEHLEALASIPEPGLLYAGSAGLARALAALYGNPSTSHRADLPRCDTALTICGSPHPVTRAQLAHLSANRVTHRSLTVRGEPGDASAIASEFHRLNPAAVIVTGGDTALLALRTLGADSILIRGEFEAGVPWGILQGGVAHGRVVVTKSGGFGSPDCLTRIARHLTGDWTT